MRNSLEQNQKGKVFNTAANYKRVLQADPLLKGAIRKNLLTERIDIVRSLGWYRDSPTLTDVDIKYLLLYFEENYGLTVEKKIEDAVKDLQIRAYLGEREVTRTLSDWGVVFNA